MTRIAKRMSLIDASGIRKVFDLAAQIENPINLSIGQPDFEVPEEIREAAVRAIRQGRNRYTVTQGIEPLRARLKSYLRAQKGLGEAEVLITSGVSGGLLLGFLALVDPGDEVLIPDPYFVIYKHLTNLLGGVPVYVDTYPDFRLREERIRPLISARTKLMVVNSPSNPTGVVYSRAELEMTARLAREHGFLLLSDEIYDEFTYDETPPSVASLHESTLLLGGFSKTYAIPGWRMGYAYGPPDLIAEMTKLQQYTFVCAPSFAQYAILEALESVRNEHREAYRAKRDLIYEGLKDAFEVERPGGAFYIFPKAPWGSDEEFVHAAIQSRLLIIPGSVFSEARTHFRISFAAPDSVLREGVQILQRLASKSVQK
ncbi:MAG: aminotransferase class I/II-fold pyridoxal phosphate-dependent enzyme [Planctomycetes bacterium]|nr:aminotransferase class I/II-fold pyridoxal phosphate-dependent enzyme [Planctomycetota bacterium]